MTDLLIGNKPRLTQRERMTLRSYGANAEEWSKRRQEILARVELTIFGDLLRKNFPDTEQLTVLDIGSGNGLYAGHFMNNGYRYIGIEPVKELIAIAKQQVPEGDFRKRHTYDTGFPKRSCEAAWLCSTLPHVPHKRFEEALISVRETLMYHGIAFISLKEGDGEAKVPFAWNHNYRRLFAYWRENAVKSACDWTGLEIKHFHRRYIGPTTWLCFFLEKK